MKLILVAKFAGPLVILFLFAGIVIMWFGFSYQWNKQEGLSLFLEKNSNALIEKGIPIVPDKPAFFLLQSDTSFNLGQECDLFLFPNGLILRGGKNFEDFHACAFLYFNELSHPHLKGFTYAAKYFRPTITNNVLRYKLNIRQGDFISGGVTTEEFDLFPSEKTIEILRKNNLL
jgi:hypothetical protein